MNNYCIYYQILNYNFCIVTHELELLKKQINHISKFCITPPINDELDNAIIIEYIENENIFNNLALMFKENNYEILDTFENERHYKIEKNGVEYYMQHPKKYIVKKINNCNYVVIGNRKNDTTKYVFRIIREIIVRLQENNSKFFFHATSLKINNKGISIMGNSGSGKTTLFSSILLNGGEILSNDRTFIYERNNEFMMDYFPIPVVYKLGTVQNNKALNNYILEENNYSLPNGFCSGKVSYPVPLTDLPMIFNDTTLIENSTLDFVIFPKFIVSKENYIFVKELLPEESFNFFKSVCFTPIDYESLRCEWIYKRTKTNEELEISVNNFLNKLISSKKIFYLEFGKDTKTLYELLCYLTR